MCNINELNYFVCRYISRTSPASSLRASKIVLVVFHFIRVAGAAASAGKPRSPSPQLLPPALPGGFRGVPRPADRYNPSSVSWVDPGVSCPKHLPREAPGGRPHQVPEPPQLAPLDMEIEVLICRASKYLHLFIGWFCLVTLSDSLYLTVCY